MLEIYSEGYQTIPGYELYMIGFHDLRAGFDFILDYGIPKFVYSAISAVAVHLPPDVVGALLTMPNIKYIEKDALAYVLGFPQYPDMQYMSRVSVLAQTPSWGYSKIKAGEVHASGNRGTGIRVCVIDSGVDPAHEDLVANLKGGYNFVNNTPTLKDDCGHGTHVCGIVAAVDNGIGVLGVAPEVSLFACRGLSNIKGSCSGSYTDLNASIQWAIDNKMHVINMSWGGELYSQTMNDLLKAAYNSGIVPVASAGNSGKSAPDTCGYPAKYNPVIAVAATDKDDLSASFSSQGLAVEVAAPGVKILSTVPKDCSMYCDPSGYAVFGGTSMASPHVAGLAALILKAHPSFTVDQVRGALNAGVSDLGDPGRDPVFGFGRIDAPKAISITSPPPPPPPMSAKQCQKHGREPPTCDVMDVKGFNECDTYCDCPYKTRWICGIRPDAPLRCGLGKDTYCIPKGYDSLAECSDCCKAGTCKPGACAPLGCSINMDG